MHPQKCAARGERDSTRRHILWARSCRGHSISGRESGILNGLRRNFRVDCGPRARRERPMRRAVAVEPAGRLHQRRDRADVGDRLARHSQRWRQPAKLRKRVSVVDLAPLQELGDLQLLLARDFVIGPALSESGKNPLPPRRLAKNRQPFFRRRLLFRPRFHACLAFPPRVATSRVRTYHEHQGLARKSMTLRPTHGKPEWLRHASPSAGPRPLPAPLSFVSATSTTSANLTVAPPPIVR